MENFRDSQPEAVYGYLAGLVKKLDGVFGRHEYMLIGSYVRDIYMLKAGLRSPRATHDVDFSAFVVSEIGFLNQLEELGPQSGGSASHHVTCRVVDRVDVDILPFGEVISGGIFRFKEAQWDIAGHEESYASAAVFNLDGTGMSVKIPLLEALLGLKIIAWGMRNVDAVHKDAQDFHYLLEAAVSLYQERIWDLEDFLEKFEYNPDTASAYAVGRRLAQLFRGAALDRCRGILGEARNRKRFLDVASGRAMNRALADGAEANYHAFCEGIFFAGDALS